MATGLRTETGRAVNTIAADLANSTDRGRIETLLRTDPRNTMLVNNARVGATAPLLNSDIGKMDDMIALNVGVLTRLTHAAPALVARGDGTIVNVSSIAAIAPEVLNGVYGGSKAFVLAFSQSLHHELASKGIRVQAVLPGPTATPFWGIAGVPVEHLPKEIVMSADDMVDAALAGLGQGELVTIPALPNAADWQAFEAARQALGPNLAASGRPSAMSRAGMRPKRSSQGINGRAAQPGPVPPRQAPGRLKK